MKSKKPTRTSKPYALGANPLRQGLRARIAVLPSESQQEFDELCVVITDEYQPRSQVELMICEQMAIAWWKMIRLKRMEGKLLQESGGLSGEIAAYNRFSRYQSVQMSSFLQAYRELERIKALRGPQYRPEPEEKVESGDSQIQLMWKN